MPSILAQCDASGRVRHGHGRGERAEGLVRIARHALGLGEDALDRGGQGDGRVVAIHGLDELQKELGHLVVEAKLPQQGQGPSGSYEGEGYVIVRHPETAVVEKALSRIVSVARVEMA